MKKSIKKLFYKNFFKLISKIKAELLLSYFSYYLILKKTKNRYRNSVQNEINALVIEKGGFDTDLVPLQNSQKINLYLFPENWLMTVAKSYLDDEMHCQIEYHFKNDLISLNQKKKLESIFINILKYLQIKLDINVILVKNFDYFEHQDLCKAAKKINLKIAVIYCESVTTKFSAKSFAEAKSIKNRARFPFDLILVSGPDGKNLLVENKICSDDKVVVTGYCRTDVIYNSKNDADKKERNILILFDFGFEDLQFYGDEGYGALKLAYSVTKEFGKLSQKFSDKYKFIIKTRTNQDIEKVYNYLDTFNIKKTDITVTGDLQMETIVKNAKVAIGYNSTTTLELLGTNIPFVLPYWFEAKQNSKMGNSFFQPTHNPSYIPAESPEEFRKIIIDIVNNNYIDKNQNNLSKYREDFIYNSLYYIDGQASKRTFDTLEKLVLQNEK